MKFIFNHGRTWQLLHKWRTSSLEIKACFFFHHRGSAIQKSFEGVLRSLIIQILTPFRDAYREQHLATWECFNTLQGEYRKLNYQCAGLSQQLNDVRRNIERIITQSECSPSPQDRVHDGPPQLSLEDLEVDQAQLHHQLDRLKARITMVKESLSPLGDTLRTQKAFLETKFLTDIASEFKENGDGWLRKLERILRRLLDQNTTEMNLVLFFDALDEFDGHLELIIQFLKSLTTSSATSRTRVKVCFSSRPWGILMKHFSHCPGFALQDYTKQDIENFAASSVADSQVTCRAVFRLVPTIIGKANGVFLWVRLALKVLFDTVMLNQGDISSELLEGKLRELPSDLLEFYELIIERISKPDRRLTFALLELLVRYNGPPAAAADIRDAVLLSCCTTLEEVKDVVEKMDERVLSPVAHTALVRNDLYNWGGGLVEVKTQSGVDRAQLMHQTVLEFATGLQFKSVVIGDLASIISENGHSFHVKHCISMILPALRTRAVARQHHPTEDTFFIQQFTYHAKQFEVTTGTSQLGFLYGLSSAEICSLIDSIGRFNGLKSYPAFPHDHGLLYLASSLGLSLCLRDWTERNQGGFKFLALQPGPLPLLSSLVFAPSSRLPFQECMATARLLLENGYDTRQDPDFLPMILSEFWEARSPQCF